MITSVKKKFSKINNDTNIHFMLVPSLSCPAECKYCFGPHQGPVMSENMMSSVLNFIDKITDQTHQKHVQITFHGGEPLVAGHRIFHQVFDYFTDRILISKINVAIQSNLWLLDDEFCKIFKKNKCEIGTSLDGPEHLTTLQRGQGYFARTMKGIHKANDWGIYVSCIATFTPLTLPYWQEVFDFFLKERLDFSIHASVPQLNSQRSHFNLTPKEYGRLLRQMLDYYIEHRRDIKISSLDQMCKSFVSNEGKVCTFCDCLGKFLAIDPIGDIYPCQRFCGQSQYSFGNIAHNPDLKDLLKSDIGKKMSERQDDIDSNRNDCSHLSYCRGGCPYNAWSGDDKNLIRDPYCQAYREIFDYIHQLLSNEMTSANNFEAFINNPEEGILRNGKLIELVRKGPHPKNIARTARRIVGAVELAKGPDLSTVATRLAEMGVCKSEQSAQASLENLLETLYPNTLHLNNLYLHITFDCQLRCNHCYIRAGEKNLSKEETQMSPKTLEKLIYQAKETGFRQVIITGGEPLYHTQSEEILQILKSTRMQVKPMNLVLRTNFALSFEESFIINLASAVDRIVVSVDGDESTHDSRRGKGSYAAVIRSLDTYSKMKNSGKLSLNPAELSIAAVLRKEDINGSIGQSVNKLGKRFNIKRIRFRPILPIGRAADWKVAPVSEALGAHVDPMKLIENGFQPIVSCGIGKNLYVEPSGDSFPCYAFHQKNSFLGNVIIEGLKSVIIKNEFRDLYCHTVDTNPKCSKCYLRYLCGGACRAWGREATQYNIDAPPPECNGLHIRAKELYKAACQYLELEKK